MKKQPKACPWGTEIQSLLFSTKLYTRASAKRWLIHHFFRSALVLEGGYLRARQVDPMRFRRGSFRTITLKNSNVKAVVGCAK